MTTILLISLSVELIATRLIFAQGAISVTHKLTLVSLECWTWKKYFEAFYTKNFFVYLILLFVKSI